LKAAPVSPCEDPQSKRNGDAGRPTITECCSLFRWWRTQDYYDEPGRGTLARDGVGVLITQAIHALYESAIAPSQYSTMKEGKTGSVVTSFMGHNHRGVASKDGPGPETKRRCRRKRVAGPRARSNVCPGSDGTEAVPQTGSILLRPIAVRDFVRTRQSNSVSCNPCPSTQPFENTLLLSTYDTM
jgi:hypothetical protein